MKKYLTKGAATAFLVAAASTNIAMADVDMGLGFGVMGNYQFAGNRIKSFNGVDLKDTTSGNFVIGAGAEFVVGISEMFALSAGVFVDYATYEQEFKGTSAKKDNAKNDSDLIGALKSLSGEEEKEEAPAVKKETVHHSPTLNARLKEQEAAEIAELSRRVSELAGQLNEQKEVVRGLKANIKDERDAERKRELQEQLKNAQEEESFRSARLERAKSRVAPKPVAYKTTEEENKADSDAKADKEKEAPSDSKLQIRDIRIGFAPAVNFMISATDDISFIIKFGPNFVYHALKATSSEKVGDKSESTDYKAKYGSLDAQIGVGMQYKLPGDIAVLKMSLNYQTNNLVKFCGEKLTTKQVGSGDKSSDEAELVFGDSISHMIGISLGVNFLL